MPTLTSKLDIRSEEFKAASTLMRELVADLGQRLERVAEGGGADARAKHAARGKLLPRERVEMLLDPDTPFLELSPLAAMGMYDDAAPGAGVITGIGRVGGVECVIVCNDATVKGGSYFPLTVKKHLRAQEIAEQNRLPCVYLVDSGGANLPTQDEVFPDRDHFGRIFFNQANLSAKGIPQIAVVMGSCTAGGAYVPAMSDETIMVRNQATIFLAGPPLVKAATGEIVTAEELGGADVHTRQSGVADHYAQNDAHALGIARQIVANLNRVKAPPAGLLAPREPLFDPRELYGVIPADTRKPYDVREVIARIVDGSDWLDFKPDYGPHTVVGHAAIEGHTVGIIGNNGPIDPAGAVKAAQFIQLCDQSGIPLLFLQNTTGYIVGTEAERGGIVKHGSKMIQAVTNAAVPKITLHIGASFGAGNYGMCGRAYDPRFIFAWPNNRIAVMGGEQAAKVMTIVAEEGARRAGREPDQKMLAAAAKQIIDTYDAESTALFATARLWDDGIIDPRDTRRVVGMCLDVCKEADERRLRPNSFGVARM